MLLQLNHNLTGFAGLGSEVISLQATAKIYSPTVLFAELELGIKSLNIISRAIGSDGYISINIPTSSVDIEEITERIEGNVLLTISSLNLLGDSYAVQIFDYTVDDFRYDLGAKSGTYTLILRGDFSTPPKQAINLTNYSSKKKLTDPSASTQKYNYTVNPNDYRYYSVGAAFTEGVIVGVITETNLTISGVQSLTIEIEVS